MNYKFWLQLVGKATKADSLAGGQRIYKSFYIPKTCLA